MTRFSSFPKCSRLSSGKLQDLGVGEGSKLTLVPTVEAGLMVKVIFSLKKFLQTHFLIHPFPSLRFHSSQHFRVNTL